jgi:hypothetical protein
MASPSSFIVVVLDPHFSVSVFQCFSIFHGSRSPVVGGPSFDVGSSRLKMEEGRKERGRAASSSRDRAALA